MDPTRYDFPYPTPRLPVYGDAVVATSQPLAARVGLRVLEDGGTAVDAAIATAAALTVVEPSSNGIGGDAFALVWDGAQLHGLNASGRAPARLDGERFLGAPMPRFGWDAVTVPGAVSAWVALHARFGRLPFERLLAPAARYAREGFRVGPMTAQAWARAAQVYAGQPDFAVAFLPDGRAPRAGERFRFPAQADTLDAIAATRGEAFYRGALAERIVAHARAAGAPLDHDDLAGHRADWVTPLQQGYRGVSLVELPPNGQGLIALIALGLLERHDLATLDPDGVDAIHLQVEALKLAFADARRHLADPDAMDPAAPAFLAPAYLDARAARIDPTRAGAFEAGAPPASGTVYLTTADAEGRMVSLIQSNYMGFGSGVVVPGTGIALQNRGAGFTPEAGHPNAPAGGKRPFHTIIPAFLWGEDGPLAAFGVMGGHVQAQMHVQVVVRLRDFGQTPQAAVDAPRWHLDEQDRLVVERGVDPAVVEGLRARGHDVRVDDPAKPAFFGGAQLAWRLPDGGYLAASDPRREGLALAL